MLVLTLLLALMPLAWGIEVDTVYGPISGNTLTLHTGKVINSFWAVPFARPPLGDLRFQPPQEPEPWEDVLPCHELGPVCPQSQSTFNTLWATHPFWDLYDEDCLHLNIVAPADSDGGPYPVMVYFHGGAYRNSANIQYPGHFFANEDVVYVVPNYRLGIFGFGYTGDEHAPGNMGLMDMVRALEFVRDNIANFGGDPDSVTIFGQSAGGASTGLLLMAPSAEGLFHRAIMQSGNEMAIWAVNEPEMNPHTFMHRAAERLNCTIEDNEEMVNCLKDVDWETLHSNGRAGCPDNAVCLGHAPVADGEFLPDVPPRLRQEGNYHKVPIMSGITADDAAPAGSSIPDIDYGFNRTRFMDIIREIAEAYPDYPSEQRKEDIIQALIFNFSPWPHIDDLELNRAYLLQMATDFAFGVWTNWQLRWHVEDATTYQFIFKYASNNTYFFLPEWFGTFHILDLPYVFGFPLLELNPDVRNDTLIWIDLIDYTDEDREWTQYVIKLWTNFAKYGNPTPEPIKPPGDLPPMVWEEFVREKQMGFWIGRELENIESYRQKDYSFITEYLPYLARNSTDTEPDETFIASLLRGLAGDDSTSMDTVWEFLAALV